jgi:hypothetical protein
MPGVIPIPEIVVLVVSAVALIMITDYLNIFVTRVVILKIRTSVW